MKDLSSFRTTFLWNRFKGDGHSKSSKLLPPVDKTSNSSEISHSILGELLVENESAVLECVIACRVLSIELQVKSRVHMAAQKMIKFSIVVRIWKREKLLHRNWCGMKLSWNDAYEIPSVFVVTFSGIFKNIKNWITRLILALVLCNSN